MGFVRGGVPSRLRGEIGGSDVNEFGGQCFPGGCKRKWARSEGVGWPKPGSECCKQHDSSDSRASS
jgi:hypothetical protein